MKTCTMCGKDKPLTEFHKYSRSRDGHRTRCKSCRRKYRHLEENREKTRLQQRQYRMTPKGRAKQLYASARQRAPHPFTLTEERVFSALEKGVCEVTGIRFEFDLDGEYRREPFAPSIDRIDPKGLYSDDNVQIVVWMHNLIRNEWGNDAVKKYLKNILTQIR